MNDRILLGLAAKAAGYRVRCSDVGSFDIDSGEYWRAWKPLADDGDEARLEAKLRPNVYWDDSFVHVGEFSGPLKSEKFHTHNNDKQAARRRAGVRAAAEIGKSMGIAQ